MFGFSSMPRELGHEHTWQTGGPASFGQGLPSDSQPGLTLELSPEPRETDSQASSNPRDSDRMGGGQGWASGVLKAPQVILMVSQSGKCCKGSTMR